MYSEFGAFEIGRQALNATRRAIDITGHNITNANTEGYSRQKPVMTPTEPMTLAMSSSQPWRGQVGTGARMAYVESMRDKFLDTKIMDENQNMGYWDQMKLTLEHVQDLLNEPGDTNLRTSLDDFYESLQDLAQEPDSEAARQLVVERGRVLTDTFKRTYNQVYQTMTDLNTQIKMDVDEVNTLSAQIADLNKQIKHFEVTTGENANDLIDKRSVLLEKLSKKINISTIYHDDHQVSVLVNDRLLVNKDSTRKLKVEVNDENNGFYDVRWEDSDPWSSNTDAVTVKVMPGAQNMDHKVLVKQVATNQVLQATQGTSEPNKSLQDTLGVTDGSVTINGTQIYIDADSMNMYDLAQVINAKVSDVHAEVVEDSGTYYLKMQTKDTGSSQKITLGHESDTSNLFYDLAGNGMQLINGYDANGDGIYNVGVETQASQDAVFTVDGVLYQNSTNEIDNVISDVILHLNGVGSSDLKIKPVVYNGSMMAKMTLRDKLLNDYTDKMDKLAYQLAVGFNKVHADGFGLNGEKNNPFFADYFAGVLNHAEKGWASKLDVLDKIKLSPDAVAASGGEFKAGDKIPSQISQGNNENVLKLIDTRDNIKVDGKTITDYFASLTGNIAVEGENAKHFQTRQEKVNDELEKSRKQVMGVSLDEEMTNLMQYQRTFQAAARYINSLDQMLEVILGLGGK
jgi:flagellar hook-associated protein FlgK